MAVLTNGVPEGYSPVSQCLHPRCKELHPRNLPVRSFCLGCKGHSTARERRLEVRTQTQTDGTHSGMGAVLSWTHLNTALVQSEPHLKPSALRTDRVGSEWRWLSQELTELPLSGKGLATSPGPDPEGPPGRAPR